MVVSAYHSQPLPPSGAAYAVALHLTPPPRSSSSSAAATSSSKAIRQQSNDTFRHHRGELICHLVTSRDDVVDVYEVRQRRGANGNEKDVQECIYHLRSHTIFGVVTGLGKCRVDVNNAEDKDDRDILIISFKDAKMAMMQWSDATADLVTISIHTYERAPQLAEGLQMHFTPILRVDPDSRCAALLLPNDSLAILPFYNDTMDELDGLLDTTTDAGNQGFLEQSLPYAPSFVLSLATADPTIKNVRDFAFLPSFQRPTVAILFEKDATWTGRLDERHDSCALRIITLDLTVAADASHRVISSKDGLPFDSLYLTACPQSIGGGVYITSTSAIIHMDQGGKTVGVAVNGWHALTSRVPLIRWKCKKSGDGKSTTGLTNGNNVNAHAGEANEAALVQLSLANSHIVFPDPDTSPVALLCAEDGTLWLIKNVLEGRALTSMSLEAKGASVQPSLAVMLPLSDLLLIGSMVGSSHLLKLVGKESLQDTIKLNAKLDDDMELDADLYGDTTPVANGRHSGAAGPPRGQLDFDLHLVSTIDHLGPILHAAPAIVGDSSTLSTVGSFAQTVICAGSGSYGGLSLLEPQIVPRDKRQLTLNATSGLWCIGWKPQTGEHILLASNANGSEIATIDASSSMVSSSIGLRDRTVFACSASSTSNSVAEYNVGRDLIIRATGKGVGIINERGQEQQWINLSDGKPDDIDIFNADFAAAYVTVMWTDGSLQLLHFDETAQRLKKIDLPDEVASRRFVAATVVVDALGTLRWHKSDTSMVGQSEGSTTNLPVATISSINDDDDEVDYGEDVLPTPNGNNGESSALPQHNNVWLALTTSEACLQIYSMPALQRVWQSNSLYPAPSRLDYVADASEEEEVPSLELSQVQLCHIGDVLHLTVTFENGLLNVYEANPHMGDDEETLRALSQHNSSHDGSQARILALSFVKILAKQLDVVGGAGVLNAPNGDSVEGLSLTPFVDINGLNGLFIGGVAPAWILREENSPTYLHMSAEASMTHLCPLGGKTTITNTEAPLSQFVYVQYGMVSMARMPSLDFSLPIAHQKKARTHRTYTKAAPHPLSKTIVAASIVEQSFVLFDPEDGHVIEDPSVDPTMAKAPRSALELFVDGDAEPVDGYELQQCEVVNCIELVTLRSVGSMSGLKDYIAVGTIVSHGEDRPARGATYIFDVVEVVAPQHDPAARFKLRMLVKEDCKGPITALTDMNGYVVVVMGLKLFVRSLEKDEWLITVAFLDTPFQTTNIQRLKNFMLLTDVHRSVWLVAFQEEPYRLVVISKDYNEAYQSCASFLIREEDMTIVTTSQDGVLRLYDYAPTIPASQGGQRLLVRSEYQQGGSETSCRMVIPGPQNADGGISTSSEVVLGMMNGAVQLLQPVDEEIFGTLHLLQGQLVRNVQHFAGLNPRGFRIVRNESSSRPLSKGILDGRLLDAFTMLSRPKMEELAKLVPDLVDGADQLLRYIATLRSNWGAQ